MPTIIVFSGIPCSGKSSLVKQIKEFYLCWVISRDDIRENHFNKPYVYNKKNEDEVTRIADFQFNKYTSYYRDIIIDNTHCKESYLKEWIKRKPEGYDLIIIFFDLPLWKAYYRNIGRWVVTGKWIPFRVIRNMKKNCDKIDKKKYDGVVF